MQTPKIHYDTFLAEKYSWMLGDLEQREREEEERFRNWGISPKTNGLAWDLGAGNGIQSFPLAKLGFNVIAIDFSSDLLLQLEQRNLGLPIKTKPADFTSPSLYVGESPELLLCMGDTLTHLESLEQVQMVISLWSYFLKSGAQVILGYRDLSYGKPGEKTGFPVRAEKDRIFSCMLSFEEKKVLVTDLFHQWDGQQWNFSNSSYYKLILPLDQLSRMLTRSGFSLRKRYDEKGMKILLLFKN
ncbi:methyltransferase domain protein [Leptospira broomii serovar Hurstbridge str. 5399]|uniref:Methyltransferase domain protein n=1 Tax=Leptospira broomii serovar Hurstbridge str. 5399 TaxID=1049789 RepID=T0EYM3_9LEPT|nr:methyltransferase domain-containing protein [Leptospira broomii]EQA43970.1 methyltransferase domain protein [Leptospira broomii serovar Hurstbridge str. 5399]